MKSNLIGQELCHLSLVASSKDMPPLSGQASFASSVFFSEYEKLLVVAKRKLRL